MSEKPGDSRIGTAKEEQLQPFTVDNDGKKLTTNTGLHVAEDEHSLKAGVRGPTLMEDFHFREKMTHFDHERIPERIVHARGFGAHGYFQVYKSMAEYTEAGFLQNPEKETPVFVRFSTVAGSRGSADTVRDVRGFAVKFYTDEGNYDLVGNNIPVFFIQDAMKFPDFIHAVKPEPHNEIPQAASAHDTFWDFVTMNTETAHMVMWAMSDRALPRSFSMMEGFGVHTFRFINSQGKARFVKFHWKPVLGVHSMVWDEVQKLGGKDPDFQRRAMWEAIENGDYPEFELGVQLLEEEDEFKFGFDVLDPTKLWPEELIPVQIVGKMTLNRNTDNFFAETEQIAFHPGHLVKGIDFTNDPLLQGRLFSYTDTQLSRLGGPNFNEIPINRPMCPVHNNQRDGMHRMTINRGTTAYHKNSIAGNSPAPSPDGYRHYQEKVDGRVVQERSDSFKDHYSQAALFWNSMSEVEKAHIVSAFQFELGKVKDKVIRQRAVDMFANVSRRLAAEIADAIGATPPLEAKGTDGTEAAGGKMDPGGMSGASPALSMMNSVKTARTRKVAVLAGDGFCGPEVRATMDALRAAGAQPEVVSLKLGTLSGDDGSPLEAAHSFLTSDSVLFDAIYVAGGAVSIGTLAKDKRAAAFLQEAFQHYKAIGFSKPEEAEPLLQLAGLPAAGPGLISGGDDFGKALTEAVAAHRHWERSC
ncbi:catalase [Paenibacillus pasadenensis]|uniref:catalase n=1 Tax=Paenibacillus pasadenensis TaxID=217090 RepID=UPI00203C01B3|nr:catalase [Paenibacillus pasadenensis]MCM3747773.1 catalase [Paenibacillus pasadenensis]